MGQYDYFALSLLKDPHVTGHQYVTNPGDYVRFVEELVEDEVAIVIFQPIPQPFFTSLIAFFTRKPAPVVGRDALEGTEVGRLEVAWFDLLENSSGLAEEALREKVGAFLDAFINVPEKHVEPMIEDFVRCIKERGSH